MRGVKLVVSDDQGGLKAARQAVPTGVPWQRCQFHLMRNAMVHAPKVAMLFPNEASLLRLASAVLSEISDDWETERAYLTMQT